MPPELQHSADGVSDDGAAKVSHVHLLGDVGAGKVDNHSLRVGNPGPSYGGGERGRGVCAGVEGRDHVSHANSSRNNNGSHRIYSCRDGEGLLCVFRRGSALRRGGEVACGLTLVRRSNHASLGEVKGEREREDIVSAVL